MYDVIVIGAGVVGCATARELSKYCLNILVCEKESDVCCGTSRANSAIVHSGHSTVPGSNMARLNVRGNEVYESLCRELDVGFRRCGSLNVAFSEAEIPGLQKLLEDGEKNGVPGLRFVKKAELHRMEPNLGPEAIAAVWAPSCGLVNPFEMTVALAECASRNGVEFRRDCAVTALRREGDHWLVTANGTELQTRVVVNAAGVHSDEFHNMVSGNKIHIHPRLGEYWLIDRGYADCFHSTIFQVPGPMGKGILVSPTVDGTVLIGPTALDVEDKDNVDTTAEGLERLLEIGRRTWPDLPRHAAITSFAGIRACTAEHDFVLGEPEDAPGFFDALGIESPGLTAAPAIAEELAAGIVQRLDVEPSPQFRPGRPPMIRYRELSMRNRAKLVAENPAYGRIICRCETVTEAEVRDAIRRPVGARTLDGVKRRIRAGMGRCQGGFCLPRVIAILAEELGCSPSEITKSGGESHILVSRIHE